MDPLPLPPFPNEDRGQAAIAVFWSLTSIATLVVGLRFYSRWLISGPKIDDWVILFTLVLLAITSGFVTEVARLGGFKHLMFVPLENGTRVALSLLIAQCFNICAFGTGKFSVGLLLLGVLSKTSTWRKWFIWVLICVTLAYNVAEGILMLFQCEPARAAWDPMVKGQCWSMNKKLTNIYVGGVYNIVTDAILALLPLSVIPSLQMSILNRIRLSILLGLGLLAAICSSVKLSYAKGIRNTQDLTWGTYELVVWSGAEVFVIIVCSSIPTLNVLWQRLANKGPYTPRSRAYSNTGYGNNRSLGAAGSRHFSKLQPNAETSSSYINQDEEATPLGKITAVTDVEVSWGAASPGVQRACSYD